MGELLEHLHAGATSARWLPAWIVLQVAAVASAFAGFARRTPGELAGLRRCLLGAFAGAAAGAVAFGVAIRVPAWVRSGFALSALARGGIMAYGALIGLSVTFAWLARRRGFGVGEALDRLAPCTGLLVVFARVGCFFGGCEFGTVTSAPWAVRFPPHSAAFQQHLKAGLILASDKGSLAVHPAQLYEAASGLAMIAVALILERKAAKGREPYAPGTVFAAAAGTYAACRFFIEFVRGDAARGHFASLSTGQWLSLFVLAGVGAFLTRSREGDNGAHLQQRKPVE